MILPVLSHPVRAAVLGILADRVASPSEITRELDGPSLGVVSYHVRCLEARGLIKLVRKKPRRGAIEHYYRALEVDISDEEWAALPDVLKRPLIGVVLRQCEANTTRGAL
jgi:DNA-binding transcriptional ArsR family regulator